MSVFATYSDDELFSLFSDSYKEIHGYRPRARARENMIEWLEYEMQSDVQAERQAQWEAEARWFDEQEALWKEEQTQLAAEQEELYAESQERMFYEMEIALA